MIPAARLPELSLLAAQLRAPPPVEKWKTKSRFPLSHRPDDGDYGRLLYLLKPDTSRVTKTGQLDVLPTLKN